MGSTCRLSPPPRVHVFTMWGKKMNMIKKSFAISAGLAVSGSSFSAQGLQPIFSQGTVNGNIRAYYNTRSYETRSDEGAFALGGALRAETGQLGWLSLGAGFYTAQDLDTNDDDPARVNARLGSDLEVLGEAYIKLAAANSVLTLGRQKINTPFANPGDAFIIPFTFQGYSFINKSIDNFTFELNYLNEIKNRNSDEFVDVGAWTSSVYNLADPQNTSGTLNLGATYTGGPFKAELWLTQFSDFFDTIYSRGDYTFAISETLKPFAGVQFASQSDAGHGLLGKVDSTLYGVLAGVAVGKAKLTVAYNSVAEQEDAFRNGAFLAPYSFSTSPLFTNNMLQTLENVDAGDAAKLTLNYLPSDALALQVSYAVLNFDQAPDRDAAGVDVIYSFAQSLQGLSLRWRMEAVSSDVAAVEVTNHRLQAQLLF